MQLVATNENHRYHDHHIELIEWINTIQIESFNSSFVIVFTSYFHTVCSFVVGFFFVLSRLVWCVAFSCVKRLLFRRYNGRTGRCVYVVHLMYTEADGVTQMDG